MIKPVKSSSDVPTAGAGPSARAKAPSKSAPVDDTLEFDFGSSAKPSAAPSAASTPLTSAPVEKIVEPKKEEPAIFTELKPRIHHTATPSPLSGGAKPAFASTTAVQIKNKFSVDSIKITDLTGELDQESKNQAAIPMPTPAAPVAPQNEPAPAATPVKTEIKVEPKLEVKPTPAITAPAPAAVTAEVKTEPKPESKSTPAPAATSTTTRRPISSTFTSTASSLSSTPAAPVKTSSTPIAAATSTSTPATAHVEPSKPAATSHATPAKHEASASTTKSTTTPISTPHVTTGTHAGTTPPKETTTPTRNSTMALNQPSVSDFRKNAERQAKEQHAVGNVLTWVGYAALGAVILFVALAGFGGYTLKKMIDSQSVSIAQLDARYSDQLAKQQADLAQLRADADRLSDQLAATANLMAKQQEQLKRTAAAADDASAVLKARTREITELRDRVRRLEGGRITR